MKFQDLTGQVFNKITILSYSGKNLTGQSLWLCKCDCGSEKVIAAHHLKNNQIKSCGCISSDSHKTHGMSYTLEWNSYHSAKKRCNPKFAHNKQYASWSGRGIEFRFTNFEQFYREVGPRPEPKRLYSLDRKNNDGHYEPGNVKWSTKKQQARNRGCDRCLTLQERVKELEKLLAQK